MERYYVTVTPVASDDAEGALPIAVLLLLLLLLCIP
jgi:hypothetical protein